jgi:hypothetical protein
LTGSTATAERRSPDPQLRCIEDWRYGQSSLKIDGMDLLQLLREPTSDTIADFLEAWYGPAAGPAAAPADGMLTGQVRAFAALVQGWPSAVTQNRLVDDPDGYPDGDKRVFYLENQGNFRWATDGAGRDPVVWGRFNAPGEPWLLEREPMSRFLLQVAFFEAVMGTPHGAAAPGITLAQLEGANGPLERLPWGAWRWPAEPSWFYASEDLLAFVSANGSGADGPADRFDLMIAAREPAPLTYLGSIRDIDWDRIPG